MAGGAIMRVNVSGAGGQWICTNLTYSKGTPYAIFNFTQPPRPTLAPLVVNGGIGSLNFAGNAGGDRFRSTTLSPGLYPLIQCWLRARLADGHAAERLFSEGDDSRCERVRFGGQHGQQHD